MATIRTRHIEAFDFAGHYTSIINVFNGAQKIFFIASDATKTSQILSRRQQQRFWLLKLFGLSPAPIQLAVDPHLFNLWVNWAHSGKLATLGYTETTSQCHNEDREHLLLAKLHDLGSQLQDSTFQDFILDVMVAKVIDKDRHSKDRLPNKSTINYIYAYADRSSNLPDFVVELWRRYATNLEMKEMLKADPEDMSGADLSRMFVMKLRYWAKMMPVSSRQEDFSVASLEPFKNFGGKGRELASAGQKRKAPCH